MLNDTRSRELGCKKGALVLDDGSYYLGMAWGVPTEDPNSSEVFGELCINTSMTGYQEAITDPSYASQLIVFTFPHIGNVGCNDYDIESTNKPTTPGIIAREDFADGSNWRKSIEFSKFLRERGVVGLTGIDTRQVAQKVRSKSAQRGAIVSLEALDKHKSLNVIMDSIRGKINKVIPNTSGLELASLASCGSNFEHATKALDFDPYQVCKVSDSGLVSLFSGLHVVVIDYGVKSNICNIPKMLGASRITVANCKSTPGDILRLKPDFVLLSNGPGDPRETYKYSANLLKSIMEASIPLFGICLGHQLISLLLGCKISKMPQGHRGANHPVIHLESGKVEITSQNHGFVVADEVPSPVEITHKSLFDGTVEGIRCLPGRKVTCNGKEVEVKSPIASVQYHPESSGGPHDSLAVWKMFASLLKRK